MNDLTGDDHPTRRFSSRVGHYANYRPGYPTEMLSLLAQEVGFGPASVLADVGSGTGILSELFLRNGNMVYGIEPNDAMRGVAEGLLSGYRNFRSVAGTAEQSTLRSQSVDGVVAAQAFHWFDHGKAALEFGRIARPGGWVALIWNVRVAGASPFMADYEGIVHEFGSDFARAGRELVAEDVLQTTFGGRLRKAALPNHQDLSWEGLCGRLLSASYMPMEGQQGYEGMMHSLRRTFNANERGGIVRMEYETRVYVGPLQDAPADSSRL